LPVLVMLPCRLRLPLESSAGNRSAVAHQLTRALEAKEMLPNSAAIVTAEICATPRNVCKPRITSCTGSGASFATSNDRLFQPLDPFFQVLHFVETIQQRGILRWLRVVDLLEPGHVTLRPRLHSRTQS
jgi:hypothetical protein